MDSAIGIEVEEERGSVHIYIMNESAVDDIPFI
jgi:hypothetical protein